MKIALVHDWLTGMRGGEKVLEVFCELFPEADIFTLLYMKGKTSEIIERHKITSSYLQKMPLVEKKYRYYLPLMPHAIESLNLQGYDLVISTSHCVAKGCKPDPGSIHVCCCFTPMRYIWDQYEHYFGKNSNLLARWGMKMVRPYLQKWDVASSKRVHHFIAISQFVSDRIKNFYGRESKVIYPPVDTDFYTISSPKGRECSASCRQSNQPDHYLVVSALVPYKRVEIAVDAFNQNGKKLKIVGSGPEMERLKKTAGKNIEFVGWKSDEDLRSCYQNCKALVFPGIEDYGIVPLEAMACGKPVIAFRKGGATETVKENITGLFFDDQTAESLSQTVEKFESRKWNREAIRQHAIRFGYGRYRAEIKDFINKIARVV